MTSGHRRFVLPHQKGYYSSVEELPEYWGRTAFGATPPCDTTKTFISENNHASEETDDQDCKPIQLSRGVQGVRWSMVALSAQRWLHLLGWVDVPLVRAKAQEPEEVVTMSSHYPPDDLAAYLSGLEPGRLQDTSKLERHLAGSWTAFEGNDAEGMTPWKLLGRMERVEWLPPALSFVIERHGRTCAGSTRANPHRWTVNITDKTASCEKVGHRQPRPMAPRLSIQPLA
jgi:hypothetical protein